MKKTAAVSRQLKDILFHSVYARGEGEIDVIGILYKVTKDFYFIRNVYRDHTTIIDGKVRELPPLLVKRYLHSSLVVPIKGTLLSVDPFKYNLSHFHTQIDIDFLKKHGLREK